MNLQIDKTSVSKEKIPNKKLYFSMIENLSNLSRSTGLY